MFISKNFIILVPIRQERKACYSAGFSSQPQIGFVGQQGYGMVGCGIIGLSQPHEQRGLSQGIGITGQGLHGTSHGGFGLQQLLLPLLQQHRSNNINIILFIFSSIRKNLLYSNLCTQKNNVTHLLV